jgi:hypothetical protein
MPKEKLRGVVNPLIKSGSIPLLLALHKIPRLERYAYISTDCAGIFDQLLLSMV